MPLSEKIRGLKFVYENGPDNIGQDFVRPCLEECVLYRRGSGFFSSSALLSYVDALESIIRGETKIQIVCSPIVQDRQVLDVLEKNLTETQREQTIKELCDEIIEVALGFREDPAGPEKREFRQKLLAYFIATGALEIKFAVPIDFSASKLPDKVRDEGYMKNLYHVKKGYFVFDDDSCVAFSGSFNESDSGHQHHIDDTQVWKSWVENDRQRLEHVIATVDADWNGHNRYVKTYDMSEKALALAKKLSPDYRPKRELGSGAQSPTANIPKSFSLRDYQERALNAWKMNSYKGIVSMATGTGKTKIAIEALKRFRGIAINGLTIVTVPTRPLAYQWIEELDSLNIPTLGIFENRHDWADKLVNLIQRFKRRETKTASEPVLVCVNKSFHSEHFQAIISSTLQFQITGMIICDEVHHFNNTRALNSLPPGFSYRMGLSATPYESDERHLLERYFGGIVFEYSLTEAIRNGFLAKYNYHPILIELSSDEAVRYTEISLRIRSQLESNSITSGADIGDYEELDHLLSGTVAKLSELDKLIASTGRSQHTLFYCGTGKVSLSQNEQLRQLDSLARLLDSRRWKVSKVTCDESASERRSILTSFVKKEIDGIVSIRVLDEGIDIPDCRTAFILASQRSERQGIQRRGRILRKSATKSFADLYDFIIVGPHSTERALEELYGKELRRARMFASDAENKAECLEKLNAY